MLTATRPDELTPPRASPLWLGPADPPCRLFPPPSISFSPCKPCQPLATTARTRRRVPTPKMDSRPVLLDAVRPPDRSQHRLMIGPCCPDLLLRCFSAHSQD